MAHGKKPNKSDKHNHHAKKFSELGKGKDRTNLDKALKTGDTDAVADVIQKETAADRKLRKVQKFQ